MNLIKRLHEELQKTPSERAAEIRESDGRLRVQLTLSDSDRLGCLLNGIRLEQVQRKPLALAPVRIVEQITYLGEKLEIIENETSMGRSILRSVPPRAEGQDISFFEICLDRSEGLSLGRYRYSRQTGERAPVPAPLTRETLERLIKDLVELAQKN